MTRPTARRSLWMAAILAAGVVLSVPAGTHAQAPFEDSVSGSGTAEIFGAFSIDARSGPNGEHPTGGVSFFTDVAIIQGPVSCLSVHGNVALFAVPLSDLFTGYFEVTDNAGLGLPDQIEGSLELRASADVCPPPTDFATGAVVSGDIAVVDASPPPTTKAQCQREGWRSFRAFTNQGDCISFVATQGRNPPASG